MNRNAISIGGLQMNWRWVMNQRADPSLAQIFPQSVALIRAHDVLMIDMPYRAAALRQAHAHPKAACSGMTAGGRFCYAGPGSVVEASHLCRI